MLTKAPYLYVEVPSLQVSSIENLHRPKGKKLLRIAHAAILKEPKDRLGALA